MISDVPVLMITHNRLSYTKKALKALLSSDCGIIHIYDNHSQDGTKEYLKRFVEMDYIRIILMDWNSGIAGAMNYFLNVTERCEFIAKCDNDTLLPPEFIARMMPHMKKADLIQAKHRLIAASEVGTFDEWTSKMKGDGTTKFNHFIGGSGILCRRSVLSELPVTENKLMSWRQWQREHPEVRKAFATDVEIELLDQEGYPKEYEDYYKQTGRI